MKRLSPIVAGTTHGLLTVLPGGQEFPGQSYVPCLCECGRPIFLRRALWGEQESCGCRKGNHQHGGRRDPLYSTWSNMLARCTSVANPAFPNYGGRGIDVCREWLSYAGFRHWADTSGWEQGLSLDRIDNDGPYSPDNCRWATRSEQARNRRNNLRLHWDGETKTMVQWSLDPRCAVSYSTLYARVKAGWTTKDAVITPPGQRKGGDATHGY